MLRADQEDDRHDETISADIIDTPGCRDLKRPVLKQSLSGNPSFSELVERLVDLIHEAPFQAYGHGRNEAQTAERTSGGWQQRHDSYF
jgi:hypothetical protein